MLGRTILVTFHAAVCLFLLSAAPSTGQVTGTNAAPTDVPKVYSISHCPMLAEGIRVGVTKLGDSKETSWLKKDEDFYYVEERAEIILLKEIKIDAVKEILLVMGTKKDAEGESKRKSAGKGGCTISGQVIDDRGKPVRGALIFLHCTEHGLNKSVNTDRDGMYHFDGLKPAFYSIRLEKGRSWNGRHKMRRIEAGEEVEIDFIPLEDAAALCGEVLDTKGKPIAGCSVRISNLHHCRDVEKDYEQHTTETDSSGFFAFDNLPVTKFDVTINKDDVVCSSPCGTFALEKGVEKEVTVKVLPGLVKGTVEVEGGRPGGRWRVNLIATKKGDFGGVSWRTNADEDDSFTLQNLPPGSYEVKAYMRGFYGDPVFFKVKKRGKTKDLEVPLLVAGTVLFTVRDRKGEPVDGVDISKIVPGKGSSSVHMDKVSRGVYRVLSIEPGKIEFSISSSSIGRTEERVTVRAGEETEVEVTL